jgi:hypothetical protein
MDGIEWIDRMDSILSMFWGRAMKKSNEKEQ